MSRSARKLRLAASWVVLIAGVLSFTQNGAPSLEGGQVFLCALTVLCDIVTAMLLPGKSSRVALVPALALVLWNSAYTPMAVLSLLIGGLFVAILAKRQDLQTAVDYSYSVLPVLATGFAQARLPATPFMTIAVWELFVVVAIALSPARPVFRLNLLSLLAAPGLALSLRAIWLSSPPLTVAFLPVLLALALVPEDDFKVIRRLREALDRSQAQLHRQASLRQRREEQVEQLAVLLKACNQLSASLDTQELHVRLAEGVRALTPNAQVKLCGVDEPAPSGYRLDESVFLAIEGELGERERRAVSLLHKVWLAAVENARLHQELKEALEQTRASQAQMIGSMRMADMGRLAAGVAHEVNTPLGAILLAAEYALRQLDKSPDKVRRRMEEIARSAQNASASVRRLLAYTRGGQVDKVVEHFDAAAITRDAVDMLEFKVRRANAQVSLDLAPTPLQGCKADFYSLVSNLLLNALEAVSGCPNRQVSVTLRELPGGGLALRVDDSGPGVPQGNREEIFKPFVTTRPEGEGTGLGLWLCQSVTEQHRGKISVGESALGGASFEARLLGPS